MNNYLQDLFSLKGKTAIITGGSRGIGSEISLAFLNAGANVICISRSKTTKIKELKKFYMQCDILNLEQFNMICEQANKQYGGIDILVNAAGVSFPSDHSDMNFEHFSSTLSVNLTATYQCCELASSFMHNGGSIINITSICSILGFPNNPGYVASKGGVRSLTKALAIDLSTKDIRVNNIVPGYIKTDMTKDSFENPDLNHERVNRMIIKRWGEVEDISGAAIFLASNASSYVTGIDLVVDGGWTAKGM